MEKFKSETLMTEQEYLKKYLPINHNTQDKKYLIARHQWSINQLNYSEVQKQYIGTTFQLNQK